MTFMQQYLDKKQICLIKKRRYFSNKKRSYIIYDYSRNRKITTILENLIKNNINQVKD